MSGRPSAIGFGFQLFGHFPFGHADWAEEVTWKILPEFYRELDAKGEFTPREPLRKMMDAYKPQLQALLDVWDQFTTLWDAQKVPLEQLVNLAYNFDIPLSSVQTANDVVFVVGSTDATLDLATLALDPSASIVTGTFKLTVDVAGYGGAVSRDDGEGFLRPGVVLPAQGTIDYDTGALTGTTTTLTAGSNVSVSYIYTIKDENLLRSEVLNAIQFFVNKGLDSGYEIAGGISGYLATVTPLWADSCDILPTLQEEGPTEFFPRFDSFPADSIPADAVYTDFYEKWPRRLNWVTPCRTSKLKLSFTLPSGAEIEPDDFSILAESIVDNVERVRPIHVEIFEFRFEGPAAVGGAWTIPVTAESTAAGGGWTIPVVGEHRAVGGAWTIPVTAVTTP